MAYLCDLFKKRRARFDDLQLVFVQAGTKATMTRLKWSDLSRGARRCKDPQCALSEGRNAFCAASSWYGSQTATQASGSGYRDHPAKRGPSKHDHQTGPPCKDDTAGRDITSDASASPQTPPVSCKDMHVSAVSTEAANGICVPGGNTAAIPSSPDDHPSPKQFLLVGHVMRPLAYRTSNLAQVSPPCSGSGVRFSEIDEICNNVRSCERAGDHAPSISMIPTNLGTTAVASVALLATLSQGAPAGMMSAFNKRSDALKFDFGNEKVRGVNLGGWFVLEPWITPSIFEATPDNVVDEYTFGQTLGQTEGRNRLEQHWNSWITADDFAEMKSFGLNFVRIPIGYWSITPNEGDPYIQGAYDHLGNALDWANDNGIKVLIDLHGAVGSQNGVYRPRTNKQRPETDAIDIGFDNSGRRGGIGWTQGDSISQTHKALNKIRDDHASHPAVAAIELINEPMGPSLNMDTVRQFYMDGWGDLESSNVAITFHDAFEGVNSWNNWGSGMWALLLDTHHYEVFDAGSLQMGIQDHLNTACDFGKAMATNNKWTIAGEWAGAMTDCAQWLNGRGIGARYDGTYYNNGQGSSYIGSCDGKYDGTVAGLGEADHNNIKSFIEAQIVAFEKAAGWIFWTWKNENAPEWHFQNLTRAGLVPQPLSAASKSLQRCHGC
nr:glucan 1,3-beta-glucosidase [Quercus suber]